MARTITEIYDSLITEKQTYSSLVGLAGEGSDTYAARLMADLNSNSKVAIWRLMLWIVAFSAWTVEKLMDNFRTEMTGIAAQSIAGTDAWLIAQVKLFEKNNTTLMVNSDRKVVYALSNPADRIVTFAGLSTENGRAVLKVAKSTGVPLASTELSQLVGYVNKIKFVGTRIAVVSRSAGTFAPIGTMYYESTGNLDTIRAAAQTAFNNYIATLNFNSSINTASVTDAIQKAEGVVSVDLRYRYNGVEITTGPLWVPPAGYVLADAMDSLTWTAI